MIQGYRMSLFKSKCSKSKLPNTKKIAEHSKVFYLKFTDSSRQEHDAVRISSLGQSSPPTPHPTRSQNFLGNLIGSCEMTFSVTFEVFLVTLRFWEIKSLYLNPFSYQWHDILVEIFL